MKFLAIIVIFCLLATAIAENIELDININYLDNYTRDALFKVIRNSVSGDMTIHVYGYNMNGIVDYSFSNKIENLDKMLNELTKIYVLKLNVYHKTDMNSIDELKNWRDYMNNYWANCGIIYCSNEVVLRFGNRGDFTISTDERIINFLNKLII